MTKDEGKKAFDLCDAAFQVYIREATETHRLLSILSNLVSGDERFTANTQRIRENQAELVYFEARNALFKV